MVPINANFVLADEINRAPAKVQSALLEAMQERQITIGDETFKLPGPFLVMATQNPVEQEGTYPLPEAQVDRFMLKVLVNYPSIQEEIIIMQRMAQRQTEKVEKVTNLERINTIREIVDKIFVDDKLYEYVANIVSASRAPDLYDLKDLKRLIEYGASPQSLYLSDSSIKSFCLSKRSRICNPSRHQDDDWRRITPSHPCLLRSRSSRTNIRRYYSPHPR